MLQNLLAAVLLPLLARQHVITLVKQRSLSRRVALAINNAMGSSASGFDCMTQHLETHAMF